MEKNTKTPKVHRIRPLTYKSALLATCLILGGATVLTGCTKESVIEYKVSQADKALAKQDPSEASVYSLYINPLGEVSRYLSDYYITGNNFNNFNMTAISNKNRDLKNIKQSLNGVVQKDYNTTDKKIYQNLRQIIKNLGDLNDMVNAGFTNDIVQQDKVIPIDDIKILKQQGYINSEETFTAYKKLLNKTLDLYEETGELAMYSCFYLMAYNKKYNANLSTKEATKLSKEKRQSSAEFTGFILAQPYNEIQEVFSTFDEVYKSEESYTNYDGDHKELVEKISTKVDTIVHKLNKLNYPEAEKVLALFKPLQSKDFKKALKNEDLIKVNNTYYNVKTKYLAIINKQRKILPVDGEVTTNIDSQVNAIYTRLVELKQKDLTH